MSLHEATVLDIRLIDGRFDVVLEGVTTSDCRIISGTLSIPVVTDLTVDGVAMDSLSMAKADGEVIHADVGRNFVYLIIEWNDFVSRESFTKAYRVSGDAVLWEQ